MKIVVGVDGSATANTAALVAGRLAQALNAQLHVVSAYKRDSVEHFDGGTLEVTISSHEHAQAIAENSAARVAKAFNNVEIICAACKGRAAEAIADYARSQDADLLVIGNKHVQGLSRVLGSVAREVISIADCDVYIAHTHD